MPIPQNAFKKAIADRTQQIGLWCSLGTAMAAEITAKAGFDWVVLDAEHAPNDPMSLLPQLITFNGTATEPVVRVPINDWVMIKKAMDIGARTLLVPMVNSAEEARQAVAAVRYPPEGIRGVASAIRANDYGRLAGYHQEANAQVCLIVQVETQPALDALEEICAVDGVDAVFFGPSDISAALGYLGQPRHDAVRDVLQRGLDRATAAGKPAGTLMPVEEDAAHWLKQGYTFVAVGNDAGVVAKGTAALAAKFKG